MASEPKQLTLDGGEVPYSKAAKDAHKAAPLAEAAHNHLARLREQGRERDRRIDRALALERGQGAPDF